MSTAVSYALVDFVTGGPIIDLPVMQGAEWAGQLNRPDSLSCTIDLKDSDAKRLDLKSSSEPNKTLLVARTDDDVVVAWGMIGDDDRTFDQDAMTLTLSALGIGSSYFGNTPIMPSIARTAPLTVLDPGSGLMVVNPALNTTLSGWSHGTIGKKLIQQQLTWPGAPEVFDFQPDEIGDREESYLFTAMKSIGSALDDLVKQDGGPDFAFDAMRAPDGLGLRYFLRHGSEAEPRLGVPVGAWSISGVASPITGLKIKDAVGAGASMGWMTGGKSAGTALVSRIYNPSPIDDGYPPFAIIDTSRSSVGTQALLDSYNAANMDDAGRAIRDLEFEVRGDAKPGLGQYRPGDTIMLDPSDDHPWEKNSIPIRIMSISGDETGKTIKIGCVILDGP